MTTLVTGASGQLGLEISRRFGRDGDVVAMTRAQLDITDHGAVLAAVARARPDVIVNCAAYNDVDGAETNPVTAMTVNGLAVRSLAAAARETGATLVHYSTDFVFDGQASRPYDECAEPAPQSVYASSKLLGEWFATGAPRHYVLRVESLFGGGAESPHPAGRRLGSTLDRIVDALLDGRPGRGGGNPDARVRTGSGRPVSLRQWRAGYLVRGRPGGGVTPRVRVAAVTGCQRHGRDAGCPASILRLVQREDRGRRCPDARMGRRTGSVSRRA